MFLDIALVIFIILAMIAGYLAGGIREIIKLCVLVGIFFLFEIPSLDATMREFSGEKLYTNFYIFAFLVAYFVAYWVIYLALKGLIKEREGTLGDINKTIGVITGFFRGIAVLTVMVYILEALFKKNMLIELKPHAADSLFYNIASTVLEKIGLIFF